MAYSLRMEAETEDHHVKVDAAIQNLDHAEDALHLMASYDLKQETISADLTYFEDQGGLAAGLMGLADAGKIQLTVKADGPSSRM